jgi:hypothetical protein
MARALGWFTMLAVAVDGVDADFDEWICISHRAY